MDFRRARAFLILAFALLDLALLLGLIVHPPAGSRPVLVGDTALQLREELRARGVVLAGPVPAAASPVPLVLLSDPGPASVWQKHLGGRVELRGTRVRVVFPPPAQPGRRGPGLRAWARFQPWLGPARLVREVRVRPAGGEVGIFQETAGGLPVFSGVLALKVDGRGHPVSLLGTWYRVLGRGTPRAILPASDALLAVPADRAPLTVRQVTLGYLAASYRNARRWEAPPVWRLGTSRGVIYVNAYTGRLEHIQPVAP